MRSLLTAAFHRNGGSMMSPRVPARRLRPTALIAAGLVTLTGLRGAGAAEPDISRAAKGQTLVQAALDAELAGDAVKRAALLDQAIAADPDFAPARWQSGQVKFDGSWRRVDEVATIVAN